MKHLFSKKSIELAARIYVFIILNNYGIGKILGGQFYRHGNLPEAVAVKTLTEASAFDLAWTFMGYSQAYILFIGLSQIIGSWCLLFNKTKLIGIFILIPILVNIIVFDMIFLPDYGALSSACIYFFLLLLILYLNRDKFLKALKLLVNVAPNEARLNSLKTCAIVILLIAIVFTVDQMMIYLLDKI